MKHYIFLTLFITAIAYSMDYSEQELKAFPSNMQEVLESLHHDQANNENTTLYILHNTAILNPNNFSSFDRKDEPLEAFYYTRCPHCSRQFQCVKNNIQGIMQMHYKKCPLKFWSKKNDLSYTIYRPTKKYTLVSECPFKNNLKKKSKKKEEKCRFNKTRMAITLAQCLESRSQMQLHCKNDHPDQSHCYNIWRKHINN